MAELATTEPRPTRPHMPGYDAMLDAGPRIPWEWARERLERSHNYWFATTTPSGAPHVMPVWGVWLRERFLFSTSPNTKKVRNFRTNPRCVVTTESGSEAVIVEGSTRQLEDAQVEEFIAVYTAKYHERFDASFGPFYQLVPKTAFGFIEGSASAPYGATRWLFEDD
ncbi:MAG: pyridoxamine 5'-phosphate oxidase family protein [Tepidiformaceae bacterium]